MTNGSFGAGCVPRMDAILCLSALRARSTRSGSGSQYIELIEHDDFGLVEQGLIEKPELLADDGVALDDLRRSPVETVLAHRAGSHLPGSFVPSRRCTKTRVRSMCLRNLWPSPIPRWAPSIRPGMSATTKLRNRACETTPRLGREGGELVIRDLRAGGADAGDERRLARIRKADDADVGNETEFQVDVRTSPSSPGCANRGA